jgi:hypothetical protein
VKFTTTKVVAKLKQKIDGKVVYACDGEETGFGRVIDHHESIAVAKDYGSPWGIISSMGGHWTNYLPVEVHVTYETGKTLSFPDEKEVRSYWDSL